MKTRIFSLLALVQLFVAGTLLAPPKDHQPYAGLSELGRMKALAGVWNGKMDISVEYRVVADGSAVEERTFADTPMEMVSMYHDKDGKLAMAHYCMLLNHPSMVLESADEQSINLDFDESCGIDAATESHMHALAITFNDDDTLTRVEEG